MSDMGVAPALALIDRAIEAAGGDEALGALKTIRIGGREVVWEHEYSYSAMPNAEPREGSRATFVIQRDFAARTARLDWDRDIVRLRFRPYPTLYRYAEILNESVGYVEGLDSSTPTFLSRSLDPPGSPMSSIRLITTWRELTRESPLLLREMKANPAALCRLEDVTVDGRPAPAVRFDVPVPGVQTALADWQFIVVFDPNSGLPLRIRTLDGDPIQGTTEFDLVLSDWRPVGPLRLPFRRVHEHNGRTLVETVYDEVSLDPPIAPTAFEMPAVARATATRCNATEAFSGIPYQWTLRRVKWGGDINTDAVAWDATANAEPWWVTVLPGIDWTDGVTHNSIMIEMADYLIVWEASLHENFAEWMIRSLKRRYPGKPVRYLVLSHHHLDHNGGARPFVAEGASVIVPDGPGFEAYFDRLFAPHSPHLNDRLHRAPRRADIVSVSDTLTLDDGERRFMLYNMKDSEHAPGLLLGFVPDVALVINTDLWNTNEKLGAKPLKRQQELLDAVARWNVRPVHSASGHGPVVPYALLRDLSPA